MMAEDFAACAAKVHVKFGRVLPADELQSLVEGLLTRIALETVQAGTRLIGHIKCIAEISPDKYIASSVTTPDGRPRSANKFDSPSDHLDIVINVLQYGLSKEAVEEIVENAALHGFEKGSTVSVEDLDEHHHGHKGHEHHSS